LTPSLKVLGCASVLALALLAGTVAHPAAAAHKPACWQVLLNDWYDGRIDGTYPLHCYQDALRHLPSDVDTYSSARDDIERALASARAAAHKVGKGLSPNTLVHPSSTVPKTQAKGHRRSIVIVPVGRKPDKGIAQIADKIDPGSPSSLPVPLLVLGGLALLLVALGGAGLVARRVQGRKPGP
jgi:hypothetical protein